MTDTPKEVQGLINDDEPDSLRNEFVEWVEGRSEVLDEKSVYAVNVKSFKGNPIHAALLQTGFDSGAYGAVISQGDTYSPREYEHIEVVEKLIEMPTHGTFPENG